MAERRDYVALDWVSGEIDETLKQARNALEAYVADPEDTTKLRFCLTYAHQVHGTLRMVEFHGAALFAREIEALAQALVNGQVSDMSEALQAMMAGLLQLPSYLERVRTARHDLPGVLLPIINDMRAIRGESLLSESALFAPELNAAQPSEQSPLEFKLEEFQVLVKKLRQMFQIAFVGIIRNKQLGQNLEYLAKVCQRLKKISQGKAREPLWKISMAIIEGLANRSINPNAAVKSLLKEIDSELKGLLNEGPEWLDKPVSSELLKNFLYYVARSDADSPLISEIQEEYKLKEALAQNEDDEAGATDPDAMRSVVEALSEELTGIKEFLEVQVRGNDDGVENLQTALPLIKRVSDTMAVLGFSEPLTKIRAQADALETIIDGGSGDNTDALMEIASNIIEVESALQQYAAPSGSGNADAPHLDEARITVLREARTGLEQAKECIIEFVASQWDHVKLQPVPEILAGVRGGLTMVKLERAGRILQACERYISEALLADTKVPEWQKLDTLADAISSVDYFLERLSEDNHGNNENILDVATDSVAQLGYSVDSLDDLPALDDKVEEEEPIDLNLDDDSLDEDEATEAPGFEAEASNAPNVVPLYPQRDSDDGDEELAAETSIDATEESAQQESSELEESTSEETVTSGEAAVAGGAVAVSEDVEEIMDDEIAEIFIEEAREVLDTINEYFPQWQQNPGDENAMAEVRRAYHTLKGSGRMVGANNVGELAWSVENMLNRIIDTTVSLTDDRVMLVEKVTAMIPAMVTAFETSAPVNKAYIEEVMAIGEALSKADNEGSAGVEGINPDWVLPEAARAAVADVAVPVEEPSAGDAQEPSAGDVQEPSAEDTQEPANEDASLVEEELVEELPVAEDQELTLEDSEEAELEDAAEEILGDVSDSEVSMLADEDIDESDEAVEADIEDQPGSDASLSWDSELTSTDETEGSVEEGLEDEAAEDDAIKDIAAFEAIDAGHEQAEADQDEEDAEPNILLEIFENEAESHLRAIQSFIAMAESSVDPIPVNDDLQRALHTLKGSAHMAGVAPIVNIISPLEKLVKEFQASRVRTDEDIINLLKDTTRLAFVGLELLKQDGECPDFSETDSLLERIRVVSETHAPVASEDTESAEESAYLRSIGEFMIEASDSLEEVEAILRRWEDTTSAESDDWAAINEHLSGMAATASELELGNLAWLADAWVNACERVSQGELGEDTIIAFDDARQALVAMFDCLAADQAIPEANESVLEALNALRLPEPEALEDAEIEDVVELADSDETTEDEIEEAFAAFEATDDSEEVEELAAEEEPFEPFVEDSSAEVPVDEAHEEELIEDLIEESAAQEPVETAVEPLPEPEVNVPSAVETDDEVDEEIIEIFLEEAQDLMESIDESIHAWLDEPDTRTHLEMLQRLLHTLKGGARLAGMTTLGNLSHNFETFLINADVQGAEINAAFFGQVQTYQDQVVRLVEAISSGNFGATVEADMPEAPEAEESAETPDAELPAVTEAEQQAGQLPEPLDEEQAKAAALKSEQLSETMQGKGPQEVVKVSSQLIEELVNLAGETSINRGRVEEQVTEIVFALDEMDSTIERMAEQLRRLDKETEAQILFRQEQVEASEIEEFDPLEMDRYSALQQLSRSLMESASDISEVKGAIFNKARDIETLLLQQSRINTDLQEGLMRSRMVPFSRLVPRLRRIVRQVSVELNKSVELVLKNTEGEMDRSLLERMVAPFEHMLRNAVDHGIESAAERQACGKPGSGTIEISLSREGGEVVIALSDDGKGINLEAVRAKAIERGLMTADADLTDHEVLQFILQSGFSTATQVTQISGRGVGMDVVASEIKNMGGSVDIHSEEGKGTQFIVRLPFTVSVNRALMVKICGENYALPLNTIEGIVRVSPFELESYYQPDAPLFEYAGESYQLRYMGALTRRAAQPDLTEETMPLPVILVRSGDHSVAVQVDSLLGSREIVVKTLGPQFGSVQGLSGATVLGDGSVVVILDLHAMIRADASQIHQLEADELALAANVDDNRNVMVMVVDDSVTVRKVTSRFLERNGMDVLLAKDGVDAMQLLQEHKPDVMLLDIEMPRMDGFEVASRVKHSESLKDIPIIMITSRTGDKHRERAMSLGVDKYLGKPYQEAELMKNIEDLTDYTG